MKTLSALMMVIGLTPAFITAGTTENMLGFVEYASALIGFAGACTIMEMRRV